MHTPLWRESETKLLTIAMNFVKPDELEILLAEQIPATSFDEVLIFASFGVATLASSSIQSLKTKFSSVLI